MKKLYKRIIAGILTVVTIFLACSPVAFASDAGSLQSYQPETFWGWLQSIDNSSWNFWKSLLDKDICPKSPNTNGRHEFVQTDHSRRQGRPILCLPLLRRFCRYRGQEGAPAAGRFPPRPWLQFSGAVDLATSF